MERRAILYVTRRTAAPDAAYEHALRLAEELGAGLTVLHVHRGSGTPPTARNPLALDHLTHEARRRGIPVEVLLVGQSGSWSRELGALDWDRWELALKVAEPESALRRRLGATVDQRLARAPRIPIWFVPPSLGAGIRVAMATVDVAHPDHRALNARTVRAAAALAAAQEARLYVLHAWSLVGESILTCPARGMARNRSRKAVRGLRTRRKDRLDELAELGRGAVETTPIMVRGLPEEALRRSARNLGADLLVLGTLARDGLEGILVGNLAERFLDRDGLGILIVKEGGRVPRFVGTEVAA